MATIADTYRQRTPESASRHARACRTMPGGDSRGAGYHEPYPLTFARASGGRLWDVDGNEYIDLSFNFASLVHGNGYPPIVEAVARCLPEGTAWSGCNVPQAALAELIAGRFPSIEHVRFTASGTEAIQLALAIARQRTGRTKILMARHGYHGWHPETAAGTFARAAGAEQGATTLVADFGDPAAFDAVLAQRGHEIAAVLLEPVLGAAGIIVPPEGFLAQVAQAARRAGALFVLDEIITARLATGGAQSLYGVTPDLTVLGKVIGGGFGIGAVGGSAEVLAALDPRAPAVWHSGTFSGNPIAATAGVVSLRDLRGESIRGMDALAARLRDALLHLAAEVGTRLSVARAGSLLNLYFLPEVPAPSPERPDAEAMSLFHLSGMNRGLYFPARGMLALATITTETDIAEILDRARLALEDVAPELEAKRAQA